LTDVVRGSARDLALAAFVMAWVGGVLLLDRSGPLAEQVVLGVLTWVVLLGLLRLQVPLVRAQTAVVVVLATLVEYTFSPLLEAYTYRLETVPAYVPPGHGLVYVAAFALGRSLLFERFTRQLVAATVVVGGSAFLIVQLADDPSVSSADNRTANLASRKTKGRSNLSASARSGSVAAAIGWSVIAFSPGSRTNPPAP